MNNNGITKNFIDINEIIEKHELVAYYQPIFDVKTNEIVAAEALARIEKASGEVVTPGMFIPFIEDSKDACKVDWEILENVCGMLSSQIELNKKVVPISINFSKMHALEPNFVDLLSNTLDKYNVPHELIRVEVNEVTLSYLGDDMLRVMNRIHSAGYKLSIDNFGTGVSSLSFIREIPFDILKIDRSIVGGKLNTPKEKIIVDTMLYLGRQLGVDVVMEGVETVPQLEAIKKLGCVYAQGYYLSRPLSRIHFIQRLN